MNMLTRRDAIWTLAALFVTPVDLVWGRSSSENYALRLWQTWCKLGGTQIEGATNTEVLEIQCHIDAIKHNDPIVVAVKLDVELTRTPLVPAIDCDSIVNKANELVWGRYPLPSVLRDRLADHVNRLDWKASV